MKNKEDYIFPFGEPIGYTRMKDRENEVYYLHNFDIDDMVLGDKLPASKEQAEQYCRVAKIAWRQGKESTGTFIPDGNFEYKFILFSGEQYGHTWEKCQKTIMDYAKDGWRLSQILKNAIGASEAYTYFNVILERREKI